MPDLPSRRTVEHWLSDIQGWMTLLVDEHGHCPPYRWAWSGLDGARSKPFDSPTRGGGPGAKLTVEVTALNDDRARVAAAGQAIHTAMTQLEAAHAFLVPHRHLNIPAGRGRGWTPIAELRRLEAKQHERNRRGNGYGDA